MYRGLPNFTLVGDDSIFKINHLIENVINTILYSLITCFSIKNGQSYGGANMFGKIEDAQYNRRAFILTGFDS